MNVLIVGARGAGKTTLIRRVLESLDCPVWGFETEKEGDQVHIYDAGAEHVPTEENLVGLCGETRGFPVKEGFDRYAPRILAPVKAGSVMIMDELGYLESSSELFCRAVLGIADESDGVWMPGVLSRKKQVAAPILAAGVFSSRKKTGMRCMKRSLIL